MFMLEESGSDTLTLRSRTMTPEADKRGTYRRILCHNADAAAVLAAFSSAHPHDKDKHGARVLARPQPAVGELADEAPPDVRSAWMPSGANVGRPHALTREAVGEIWLKAARSCLSRSPGLRYLISVTDPHWPPRRERRMS
jgi:hypothetical protein